MYNIDWDKYLSCERDRNPESKVGNRHEANDPDMRNEFDSDFGRVIFSTAARRMHDKTQVFPLTSGDYVHTRLTHSLEVMNIAVSLGSSLCRNDEFKKVYGIEGAYELEQKICAILKTAAFVHDIGNPPYGHYGEATIQKYFKNMDWDDYIETFGVKEVKFVKDHILDFTEFDGNTEGFRILTRGQYLGDLNGLNLTFASLGAYLKYPNNGPVENNGYIGRHKHGIFATEEDVYNKIVDACHMRKEDGIVKRHPLSFLVEAADTICYTAMDLEDGISIGKIGIDSICKWVDNYVNEKGDKSAFNEYMMQGDKFSLRALLHLRDNPYKKKLDVNFRVMLISYFVKLALNNFIQHLEDIDKGLYNEELLLDDPLHIAEALGKYARENLFVDPSIVSAELAGQSVIAGLLDIVLKKVLVKDPKKDVRIYHMLSDSGLKLVHHECGLYDPKTGDFKMNIVELPLYYRLRLVVDWISGMTDKYAVETYQKLSGIKL